MPPIVSIINVLVAILAVLNFLLSQPFVPPEWLPFIVFVIAVMNAVVDLLRKLFPENVTIRALRF